VAATNCTSKYEGGASSVSSHPISVFPGFDITIPLPPSDKELARATLKNVHTTLSEQIKHTMTETTAKVITSPIKKFIMMGSFGSEQLQTGRLLVGS
jgi:hypothetical protein